jgi:hypothetical protein
MIDEGYVKYESHWTPCPAPFPAAARQLDTWRKALFGAGLIGHYAALGVGYGNISVRLGEPRQFLISGTQTGHLANTTAEHYSLVTDFDIAANSVTCTGPIQASSEALTHAAIYELCGDIGAVVHVHSGLLWKQFIDELPTTDAGVPYGTPQMALEFSRLYAESSFAERGLAVMAGHEEGLISIGNDLAQAATRILDVCKDALKS